MKRVDGILDAIPVPVFVKDEERRWVTVNDACCLLMGVPREQLLGKTDGEIFPGPVADGYRQLDDAVFASGQASENEERFAYREGKDLFVRTRRTLHVGEGGRRLLLVVVTDLADMARAERALEASETRYRRLFEAAKDGILILDAATGRIVDVNPFLLELTGYSRTEFLGHHLWEIGPFRDRSDSRAAFADLQARKYVRYEDLPLQGRDGREIAVEFISNVYLVDAQEVIQCNIRDITARKDSERKREVLEQQVHQFRRLESIGRLAGGIAHDFNNLLTVILSCAGILKEDGASGAGPQPDVVDDILIAARRAEELTGQLLAFARKQVIAPEPVDLNVVVAESDRLLRRTIGEDVGLVTSLAGDLWAVRCDKGQMEQVILNLALNARDAMAGGGTLTVATTNVTVDADLAVRLRGLRVGPHVRMRVSDTGSGMTPEVQAHAFEPFFTTKPQGKGTGLGLATVYGIVAQNEGHIFIESQVGRGTTFDLYFPRTSGVMASVTSPEPATLRGVETVLVVEDDPLVRKIALQALGVAGYRVVVAESGAEALEIAARKDLVLDLLVTDVVMPGLNGRQLADALRLTRPGLRVLYMSGYAHDVISKAGVLDTGIEFLRKPFSLERLRERVRKVLDAA